MRPKNYKKRRMESHSKKIRGIYLRHQKLIIITLLCGYFIFEVWGVRYIAERKAEKPNNIKEGCLYLRSSYTDTSKMKILRLTIDGHKVESHRTFSGNMPYGYKWNGQQRDEFYQYLEYNKEKCHPIQYVDINLLITRKIFIYDYLGDFKPTTNTKKY